MTFNNCPRYKGCGRIRLLRGCRGRQMSMEWLVCILSRRRKEITRLLKDRPELTQTYEVTGELAGQVPLDAVGLRLMDESELRELAEYLGVEVEYLRGPFRVIDAECPRCGRRVTFLDFVKTAVDKGVHDRTELGAILTGEARNWITIRGRDGGVRSVAHAASRPFECSMGIRSTRQSNYAYA